MILIIAAEQYSLFEKSNGAEMESAITVKGKVTIPKAVRDYLRLKPGDRIKFFLHPDGAVVWHPQVPTCQLRIRCRNDGSSC